MDCVPTPNNLVVMWIFNGVGISRLQGIAFTPTNLNHTLTINGANVNNSGQYTCHLIQNFNKLISRTITLEVLQSMCLYVCIAYTVNEKTFEGEHFCDFHGFSINHKSFPYNKSEYNKSRKFSFRKFCRLWHVYSSMYYVRICNCMIVCMYVHRVIMYIL